MDTKDELIAKLEEYIQFLGEELGNNAGFLYAHGQVCPKEVVDKGIRFREEIKELKDKL